MQINNITDPPGPLIFYSKLIIMIKIPNRMDINFTHFYILLKKGDKVSIINDSPLFTMSPALRPYIGKEVEIKKVIDRDNCITTDNVPFKRYHINLASLRKTIS